MKVLWTLNIDDYLPGVTRLTYPYLEQYAKKIGADFKIIKERKFPGYSVTYEKLQIHELGIENDFNIFIDSDTLIHPDFFDITSLLPTDVCFHMFHDFSPIRFRPSESQVRTKQFTGTCSWFAISTRRTHDLWKPSDLGKEAIDANIFTTNAEREHGISIEHLEDDYVISMNLAEFGFKHTNYQDILAQYPLVHPGFTFWFHDYLLSGTEKEAKIRETIEKWKI